MLIIIQINVDFILPIYSPLSSQTYKRKDFKNLFLGKIIIVKKIQGINKRSQSLGLQPSCLILVTWHPVILGPLTVNLQSSSTHFLTPIFHVTAPSAIVTSLKTVLWLKKILFVFLKDYSCRKEQRERSHVRLYLLAPVAILAKL